MEDARVLPVRRGHRRVDDIPPIRDIIFDVLFNYVLTVCLPVFSNVQYYMSLTAALCFLLLFFI